MSTSKKIRNRLNGLFKNVIESENDFVPLESKGALVEIPSDGASTPHPSFFQNQDIVVTRTSVLLEKSRYIDIQPSFSASTMNIPFQVGDEWNIIQLDKELDRNWESDEQILVSQIATQLGLALQNANLFEQTKITTQKLEAVAEIASQISSILELQPLLETATRLTQQRFGLNHVDIFLFDKNSHFLEIKACGWQTGISQECAKENRCIDVNLKISIVAKAARERKPIVDNNINDDSQLHIANKLPNVRSQMASPIFIGNKVLGILSTYSSQFDFFTDTDVSIMTILAAQIASAIQNAWLFDEAQKRSRELAILNNIVQVVAAQVGLNNVLETTYKEIKKLVPIDVFFVAFYNEKTGIVEFPFVLDGDQVFDEQSLPLNSKNYTGQTILSGNTIHDFIKEENVESQLGKEAIIGDSSRLSGALLFVPIKVAQMTIGCLSIQNYGSEPYSTENIALIETITSQLSAVILNARLFNQIRANEENLRNLVENAHEAIVVIDGESGYFSEPNSNA